MVDQTEECRQEPEIEPLCWSEVGEAEDREASQTSKGSPALRETEMRACQTKHTTDFDQPGDQPQVTPTQFSAINTHMACSSQRKGTTAWGQGKQRILPEDTNPSHHHKVA